MIGDDLIAAARVAKAGIGVTLGAFNIGSSFISYTALSIAIGSAFAASLTTYLSLYGLLDFSLTFLGDIFDSDWYAFISYTLNFDFLQGIFTSYFVCFILLLSLFVGVNVFYFSVIIIPHVMAVIRSAINWMTGDM